MHLPEAFCTLATMVVGVIMHSLLLWMPLILMQLFMSNIYFAFLTKLTKCSCTTKALWRHCGAGNIFIHFPNNLKCGICYFQRCLMNRPHFSLSILVQALLICHSVVYSHNLGRSFGRSLQSTCVFTILNALVASANLAISLPTTQAQAIYQAALSTI